MKKTIRRALLRIADTNRIHIIGCARSGTTMLHYAMAAFDGTRLYDAETSVEWHPGLLQSAQLALHRLIGQNAAYVTKRSFGWYRPVHIERLAKAVKHERVGIIHVVRDPRDVLTSRHAGSASAHYVEPERWRKSIHAAQRLHQIAPASRWLTVRYEDIVRAPDAIEQQIRDTFGLRLRDGIESWSSLAQNVNRLAISTHMAKALHRVRNFDTRSIGRWRTDSGLVDELFSSPIASDLHNFMQRHGYDERVSMAHSGALP